MGRFLPNVMVSESLLCRIRAEAERCSVVSSGRMSGLIRSAVYALVSDDLHWASKGRDWHPSDEVSDSPPFLKHLPKTPASEELVRLLEQAVAWRKWSDPSYSASRFIREALCKRLPVS